MTLKIIGVLVGLAYGFLIGFLKYVFLWKKLANADEEITSAKIYKSMGISYGVDVLTLLLVFLLRKAMPFDFFWTIFAAAIGLSVSTKFVPMRNIVGQVKEK